MMRTDALNVTRNSKTAYNVATLPVKNVKFSYHSSRESVLIAVYSAPIA